MAGSRVSIRHEDFDLGAEVTALREGDGGVGAVAAFVGTVRDRSDGRSVRMALDQEMSDEAAALRDGCEVAFFPPVTGG